MLHDRIIYSRLLLVMTIAALCIISCKSSKSSRNSSRKLNQQIGANYNDIFGPKNGLLIREWTIEDNPQRIALAMSKFGLEELLEESQREDFRRNGLRLVRVWAEDIDPLLKAFDGASSNTAAWHGQVYNWAELLHRQVKAQPIAVAVDGHVKRYKNGTFRLMLRSWTVSMEDGPRLQLQLLPQFDKPQRVSIRGLRADRSVKGEVFRSFSVETLLEAGFVYVLTYASPQAIWEIGKKPGDNKPQGNTASNDAEGTTESGSAVIGGFGIAGPGTILPPTYGELMCRTAGRFPTRRILVFEPTFPLELFPPGIVPPSRPVSENENSDVAPN